MIQCCLCKKEQKSLLNLSRHLTNNHHYSPEEYYNSYMKNMNENICVICKKETKYLGFTKGYNNTCSHQCGAKLFRKELKEDAEKFKKFQDKVSLNQEKIWEERKNSGENKFIRDAISETRKKNISLLSLEERKEKFGWLNSLSNQEKKIWKKEVLFETGCFAWWKSAKEEQKVDLVNKRNITRIENGTMIDPSLKSEKEKYYERVRYLSYKTYNKYKKIINPSNLTISRGSKNYHLDHIISIQSGFLNKIPAEIISSMYNLQILPAKINNEKSSNSWQSIELLMEKYKNG